MQIEEDDFGVVFKVFIKKYGIYGFGDSQVKRMYMRIKKGGH